MHQVVVQQFARPPQVLLVVGAVLLVSAGIAVATTSDGPWARVAVLALAVLAAAASLVADEAELRSSAETFAASAAGEGLAPREAEERGIRLAMLSDYYQCPREAPQHVLVVNYTGIDTEKLPTALARLAELWPS